MIKSWLYSEKCPKSENSSWMFYSYIMLGMPQKAVWYNIVCNTAFRQERLNIQFVKIFELKGMYA